MQGLECTFDNRMSTMKDFKVIKQVGKGSYGVVYKVKRKSDGNIYAIKTISLSKSFKYFVLVFRFHILSFRKMMNQYLKLYFYTFN